MSAREHYRAPCIVLPDLPPEIWISIFRFATWSSNTFNPQLMISADISYREQFREFKRSLITKRYLVLVCKAWYSLASPFLFESIFLGKGKVLAPLRDAMLRSESAVESQELPHSIGWRIQRLDVHMRDRTENPGLIMDILADILKRLSNLRILTFAVVGHGYNLHHLPENVLQATNACRHTLFFLNWYGGLELFFPNTWASFLENHPQLEAINVPVALTQLGNSHITLNSLKSVYVYTSIKNGLWNIEMPNIHHAIYDISSTFPGFEFAHDNECLPKIGDKLTSIQINCLEPWSADNITHAFYDAFLRITLTCKNLVRVDIVSYEWMLPHSCVFPPTVHTLGIKTKKAHQISKRRLDALLRSILDFLSGLHPSLKTICFMDQGNVRALCAHSRLLSSSLACILNLGVNVVDHEGRPFCSIIPQGTIPSKLWALASFDSV